MNSRLLFILFLSSPLFAGFRFSDGTKGTKKRVAKNNVTTPHNPVENKQWYVHAHEDKQWHTVTQLDKGEQSIVQFTNEPSHNVIKPIATKLLLFTDHN